MFIFSQTKDIIVNADNIADFSFKKNTVLATDVDGNQFVLGNYEDVAKALQLLFKALRYGVSAFEMPENLSKA